MTKEITDVTFTVEELETLLVLFKKSRTLGNKRLERILCVFKTGEKLEEFYLKCAKKCGRGSIADFEMYLRDTFSVSFVRYPGGPSNLQSHIDTLTDSNRTQTHYPTLYLISTLVQTFNVSWENVLPNIKTFTRGEVYRSKNSDSTLFNVSILIIKILLQSKKALKAIEIAQLAVKELNMDDFDKLTKTIRAATRDNFLYVSKKNVGKKNGKTFWGVYYCLNGQEEKLNALQN